MLVHAACQGPGMTSAAYPFLFHLAGHCAQLWPTVWPARLTRGVRHASYPVHLLAGRSVLCVWKVPGVRVGGWMSVHMWANGCANTRRHTHVVRPCAPAELRPRRATLLPGGLEISITTSPPCPSPPYPTPEQLCERSGYGGSNPDNGCPPVDTPVCLENIDRFKNKCVVRGSVARAACLFPLLNSCCAAYQSHQTRNRQAAGLASSLGAPNSLQACLEGGLGCNPGTQVCDTTNPATPVCKDLCNGSNLKCGVNNCACPASTPFCNAGTCVKCTSSSHCECFSQRKGGRGLGSRAAVFCRVAASMVGLLGCL